MALHLTDPLAGVLGARTAKVLDDELGLRTVDDLVRHYPRRYDERTRLTDIAAVELDEHVTVLARVERAVDVPYNDRKTGRRTSRQEIVITDGTTKLLLTFFKQKWRVTGLRAGAIGMFAGKVSTYRGQRQLVHPDYRLLPDESVPLEDLVGSLDSENPDGPVRELELVLEQVPAVMPVYPGTEKAQTWVIAAAMRVVLDQLPDDLSDPIPYELRAQGGLADLATALRLIHRPSSYAEVGIAKKRLTYEEALVLQTVLACRRADAASQLATPRLPRPGGVLAAFDDVIPYDLTAGQLRVGQEIASDLASAHPMQRLLHGEVGSGKTVVALRAMLTVVDSGGQAVLLAPTETLAHQHLRSIRTLLGDLGRRGELGGSDVGTSVVLVTGAMPAAARRAALLDVGVGNAGIVIGTHALLEDRVQFFDLGLVVIDEQHRFGVEQRAALAAKARDGTRPHTLVMTATPIPRTIAMTVYGDLETSTLDELPSGRAPITTHVVDARTTPAHLDRVWKRIAEEVEAGRQAYVVCARISAEGPGADELPGDDTREVVGVEALAVDLADGPLAGVRRAVLHGRMASEDKDAVMQDFAAGRVDLLIATTVIEVGVDVHNAVVMVVMDADRFGVATLHQLRGRVGRGGLPGLCLLVTTAAPGSPGRVRLDQVAATTDGYALSRLDLENRREGDVLGAIQSGRRSRVRLLELLRHEDVIAAARVDATAIVGADRTLAGNPGLRDAVEAATERATNLDKS